MRRTVIVALLCVNVALIVALAACSSPPKANAQVVGGGSDYLMMTGHMGKTYDAIYILELNSHRLAALRFDRTTKKLVAYQGRKLADDFKKEVRP